MSSTFWSRVQANESLLTGESVPVEKGVAARPEETVIAERDNMLFKGTAITKGNAEGDRVGDQCTASHPSHADPVLEPGAHPELRSRSGGSEPASRWAGST
ncbi:MAG: hypothetical protein JRG93_12775 [Deltaproteobacteria bacterium]|nr:hypothetical protein [Deltaproteobacteria bacterium]